MKPSALIVYFFSTKVFNVSFAFIYKNGSGIGSAFGTPQH